MMNPRKFLWPLVAVAALGTGSFFATLTGPWAHSPVWAEDGSARPTPNVQPEVAAPIAELSRAFRHVHESLKDAVVNIDTTRKAVAAGGVHSRIPDELRKMLPPGFEFDTPDDGAAGPRRSIPMGTGSGVIVSADGYILTNNHVVEDSDTITVRLDDGRELKAKIIGRDPKSDLAVVKIDANNLTYAKLGDSDALDVGDWVLAFGSPFGFDQSMTQGIISAKGRQVNIIGMNNPNLAGLTYENFLQTDAAINPGNSGGPLVNLRGEVIGINTAIASRSGAYNGIGFSIPSNDARYIMDSLIKTGKVVRGYMGVGIADVRETRVRQEAKSLGYSGNNGVLVKEVKPDSPGGKGGLKLGDVITAVNGKKVDSINELRTVVARTAPGSKITLDVFRNGKTEQVTFPVGTQPETAFPVAQGGGEKETPAVSDFQDLGLNVAEQNKGLTITEVDPNGLAAEAGLSKGDVIFSVEGQPVKTTADFKTALSKKKLSQGVHMSIRGADGSERLVYIEKQ